MLADSRNNLENILTYSAEMCTVVEAGRSNFCGIGIDVVAFVLETCEEVRSLSANVSKLEGCGSCVHTVTVSSNGEVVILISGLAACEIAEVKEEAVYITEETELVSCEVHFLEYGNGDRLTCIDRCGGLDHLEVPEVTAGDNCIVDPVIFAVIKFTVPSAAPEETTVGKNDIYRVFLTCNIVVPEVTVSGRLSGAGATNLACRNGGGELGCIVVVILLSCPHKGENCRILTLKSCTLVTLNNILYSCREAGDLGCELGCSLKKGVVVVFSAVSEREVRKCDIAVNLICELVVIFSIAFVNSTCCVLGSEIPVVGNIVYKIRFNCSTGLTVSCTVYVIGRNGIPNPGMTECGNYVLFVRTANGAVSLLKTYVLALRLNGGVPSTPRVTESCSYVSLCFAAVTAGSCSCTCISTGRLNSISPIRPSVTESCNSLNVGCAAAVLTSSLKKTCIGTSRSRYFYVLAPNVFTGSNAETGPVSEVLGLTLNRECSVAVIDNCTNTSEVNVNTCAGSCVPVVTGTDGHVVHLFSCVDAAHIELIKCVGLVDVCTVSRVGVLYVVCKNACIVKGEESSHRMTYGETKILTLIVDVEGLRRNNLTVFHNVSGDYFVRGVSVSGYRSCVHIDNETVLNHTVVLYCKTVLYSIAVSCKRTLKLCFRECDREVNGICTVVTAGHKAELHEQIVNSSGVGAL